MKQPPTIPIRIDAICQTIDDAVLVKLHGRAKAKWLPRDEIDFCPGYVIVPAWRAKQLEVEQ